jgi:hypothetical protein
LRARLRHYSAIQAAASACDASLYPTHGACVSKAVDDLVGRRFPLRENAQTLLTDAS